MSDEDQYPGLDISDAIEDTEQYSNIENQDFDDAIDASENTETGNPNDPHILNSEELASSEKKVQSNKNEIVRPTRLPTGRVKTIMKMDPDVNVVTGEAVFLVTKATELFLETLAKETYSYTAAAKKKTIAKKDLDTVFNKVDCLCFLEGAMDF